MTRSCTLLDTENKTADYKSQIINLQLTDVQQQNIKKAIRRGIYKELYQKELLSDVQLNNLLEKNT